MADRQPRKVERKIEPDNLSADGIAGIVKDLLDKLPSVGDNVRIAYTNNSARVLSVKERSKAQELGR